MTISLYENGTIRGFFYGEVMAKWLNMDEHFNMNK